LLFTSLGVVVCSGFVFEEVMILSGLIIAGAAGRIVQIRSGRRRTDEHPFESAGK